MSGRDKFGRAVGEVLGQKEDAVQYIPGELGRYIDGQTIVSVPNRASYVYVRLWSNPADWVEAYNDTVNTIYGLPVLVVRDKITPDRYRVVGKDIKKYSEWNTPSGSQLAPHGPQHSFGYGEGAGSDIVWVFKRQFMPLLLRPLANFSVYCESEWYRWNDVAKHFPGQGIDLEDLVPATLGEARFVTISIDGETNVLQGTTGTVFTSYSNIEDKVPTIDLSAGILLGSVLLYKSQTAVTWSDIYDLRLLMGNGGGAGSALTDIIRYSGGVATEYDPDDTGLSLALSEAVSGDTIQLPPETTFVSEHTLPPSVHMFGLDRETCILGNRLIVNPGSSIATLSILLNAASGSGLYGFYMDASGTFAVDGCSIEVINTSSGTGYAGYVDLLATVTLTNNEYIYGSTDRYLIE